MAVSVSLLRRQDLCDAPAPSSFLDGEAAVSFGFRVFLNVQIGGRFRLISSLTFSSFYLYFSLYL